LGLFLAVVQAQRRRGCRAGVTKRDPGMRGRRAHAGYRSCHWVNGLGGGGERGPWQPLVLRHRQAVEGSKRVGTYR
jgi:hypothetical protein